MCIRDCVSAAPSLLCAVAVMSLPVLVPRPVDGPTARFMAVQGNVPRPGLDFNAERRAVLDNHARETLKAAGEVQAGKQPPPDLVVWPENASDIDPLRNPDAAVVINDAVDAIHAPLILGAVLQGPRPYVSNASLMYLPGQGVTSQYIKQHPVPFAEYIPYRSFFRHFSDKVDLVASDLKAGPGAGVFRVPALKSDETRSTLSLKWRKKDRYGMYSANGTGCCLMYCAVRPLPGRYIRLALD